VVPTITQFSVDLADATPGLPYTITIRIRNDGLQDATRIQLSLFERQIGTATTTTVESWDQIFTSGNELGPGDEITFTRQITKFVEEDFVYTINVLLYNGNGDAFPCITTLPSFTVNVELQELILQTESGYVEYFEGTPIDLIGTFTNLELISIMGATLSIFPSGSLTALSQAHFDSAPLNSRSISTLLTPSGPAQGETEHYKSYSYDLKIEYAGISKTISRTIRVFNPKIQAPTIVSVMGGIGVDPYPGEDFGFNIRLENPTSTLTIDNFRFELNCIKGGVTYNSIKYPTSDVTANQYIASDINPTTNHDYTFVPESGLDIHIDDIGTYDVQLILFYTYKRSGFVDSSILSETSSTSNIFSINLPPEASISLTSIYSKYRTQKAAWYFPSVWQDTAPSFPYKTGTNQPNIIVFKFAGTNTGHSDINFKGRLNTDPETQPGGKLAASSIEYSVTLRADTTTDFEIEMPVLNSHLKEGAEIVTDVLVNDVGDILLFFAKKAEVAILDYLVQLFLESFWWTYNFFAICAIRKPHAYILDANTFTARVSNRADGDFRYSDYADLYPASHKENDESGNVIYVQKVGVESSPDGNIPVTMTATDSQFCYYWEAFIAELISDWLWLMAAIVRFALEKIGSGNPIAAFVLTILLTALILSACMAEFGKYALLLASYLDPIELALENIEYPDEVDPSIASLNQLTKRLVNIYDGTSALVDSEVQYNNLIDNNELSEAITTGNEISTQAEDLAGNLNALDDDFVTVVQDIGILAEKYIAPLDLTLDFTESSIAAVFENGLPSEAYDIAATVNAPQIFIDNMENQFENTDPGLAAEFVNLMLDTPGFANSQRVADSLLTTSLDYRYEVIAMERKLDPAIPSLSQQQLDELEFLKEEISQANESRNWMDFIVKLDFLEQLVNSYINLGNIKDPACIDCLKFIQKMRQSFRKSAEFNVYLYKPFGEMASGSTRSLKLFVENVAATGREFIIQCIGVDPSIISHVDAVLVEPSSMATIDIILSPPMNYPADELNFEIKVSDTSEPLFFREIPVHVEITKFIGIIIQKIGDGFAIISDSDEDCWKKPGSNRRNAMIQKLDELKSLVLEGEMQEAYDKLLHDIKPKLTGLKTDEDEAPWGNGLFNEPWVINTDLQEQCRIWSNDLLTRLKQVLTVDINVEPAGQISNQSLDQSSCSLITRSLVFLISLIAMLYLYGYSLTLIRDMYLSPFSKRFKKYSSRFSRAPIYYFGNEFFHFPSRTLSM